MIPRTPIAQKTTQRMAEARLAGLAVFGFDHLQYLADSALPFLAARRDQPPCLLWASAAPVLICPQSLAHLGLVELAPASQLLEDGV